MEGIDKEQNVIIVDFEVLYNAKFWLCCMKDARTEKEHIIINDEKEFKRVFNKNSNSIWVGYNIRRYDSWIMKAILTGYSPFEVTKKIIIDGVNCWNISPLLNRTNVNYYEIGSQQRSLKELELFMGESIVESDITFDISTYPSEEQIETLAKYCMNDVRMTFEVFKHMKHEFDSQKGLIEMFNLNNSAYAKTKAQLSSMILGAKKPDYPRNDEFEFKIIDNIKLSKYNYIKEWYMNPENRNYDLSLTANVYGVDIFFGWGGLHGAKYKYKHTGIIVNSDVQSFYPSEMIEYDFLSRNVKNKDKYKQIRESRLKLKALGDKKSNSLKIVLNGTYGASKDKYNDLYDPQMGNAVCVNGQLLLLDLIEKVEECLGDKATLIQCNTDGVMFSFNDEESKDIYMDICKEWSNRTKMNLDHDEIKKVIQKDVNNYIFITNNGKIKRKGAYVKELSILDNDLPIVNKALVEKLLYNTQIRETVEKSDSLIDFQKCVKITNKYKYAQHGNEKIHLKVLRVFASKDNNDPSVTKVKINSNTAEKIGNTPEHAFIINEDIKKRTVPEKLDRDWYINLAEKRYSEFVDESKNVPTLFDLL
ncbi:hypothetical protein [Clostridium sp.]|uniref:hypothetical protein n=1 Tax=Clostridium sp. TaxID=1506 RepID=UPI0025C5FE80|nr:hypothetical protein [Clostridium sp.]